MKKGYCEIGGTKMRKLKLTALLLAGVFLLHACGGAEKEPTPLVTVQVTPAFDK